MDRCENCDRDGCREAKSVTWDAFFACSCKPELRNPCEHQRAYQVADADCQAHTVNWRERAKAAEADLTALRERMAVADAKLSRLSQLADSWSDRGGYAKGVFARDLRNVLAGTVGGGPQPLPLAPEPQATEASNGL